MRVLAIVPSLYDTSPGQRYRIEQWEPFLKERGVEITYEPFESEELHSLLYKPGLAAKKMRIVIERLALRLRLLKSVKDYDLVYLFREGALLGPPLLETLICRRGVPFVFDFDDAVFVSYRSPSNGYLSYLKFAGKTKKICRMASHVMAGNPYLADYARQANKHVTIIPTTIDTDKYRIGSPKKSSFPLVIGWTGSHSTVQHLDTLRGALRKLATTNSFRLRVIGTPSYELDQIDVDSQPWLPQTEVEDLAEIDIGVMPLPDDAWSKGKCALKALQFMALGIPTVCSPVGVNTDIIRDDHNGFIAASDDEWVEKLGRLLGSDQLRNRIGRAGRQTVETGYSARVQAPRVFEVFKSVVRDASVKVETLMASRSAASEN